MSFTLDELQVGFLVKLTLNLYFEEKPLDTTGFIIRKTADAVYVQPDLNPHSPALAIGFDNILRVDHFWN